VRATRRSVLGGIAGAGTAAALGTGARGAAGATAAAGRPATGPTSTFQSGVRGPDADPETLEGAVTTPPVQAGDRLLLGTDRGLYVFEDGSLAAFVPTRPIRTVEPLGTDRAVVLVRDRRFPNVQAVDLGTGSVAWSTAPTTDVYSQQFGRTMRQVGVFDAVAVGDVSESGSADVVVAGGYGLRAYDGADGAPLWTLEWDFYTWQLAAVDGRVYVTTQDGYLLAVDAATGERAFSVRIAERFEGQNRSVPRSAWDVEPIGDGGEALAVSAEDGTVAVIEAADGSIRWETRVHEPDGSALESYFRRLDYRPTMPGGPDRAADDGFFNVGLTVVETDQPSVAVRIRESGRGRGRADRRLALVDAGGQVAWDTDVHPTAEAGNLLYAPDVAPNRLLLPTAPGSDTQALVAVDLADGSEAERITVPSVAAERRGRRDAGRGYVSAFDDGLALAAERGDLVVADAAGEPIWGLPSLRNARVRRADLRGDGTDDLLVHSRLSLDRQAARTARSLVARSAEDGTVEWSWTRSAATYRRVGGLTDLTTIEWPDGETGLLGYQQRPRRERDDRIGELEREIRRIYRDSQRGGGDRSDEIDRLLAEIESLGGRRDAALVVLSGRDGSEQRRIPLAFRRDGPLDGLVDPVSVDDFDWGGDPVAVVGAGNRVLFVDLPTGDVFWERIYGREGSAWPPVGDRRVRYRTVAGPGDVEDMLAVAPEAPAMAIVETELEGMELRYDEPRTIEIRGDRIRPGSVECVGDLTGDGHEEVVCQVTDGDAEVGVLVATGQGRVLQRFEAGTHVGPTIRAVGDPAGPGRAVVACGVRENRSIVTLHDGADERLRLEYDGLAGLDRSLRPAVPVGDGPGGGRLAVGARAPDGGATLDVYAVGGGERLERIELEPLDGDPPAADLVPAFRVQRIPDALGSGDPAVGVLVDADGDDERELFVVDPATGEVLVSGPGGDGELVSLEESIGVVGSDGSLRTVDPTAGVTIEEPDTSGSSVDLSWRFGDDRERVTTVTVDGDPVAVTDERSTSVRLPAGSHTVAVEARDADGFAVLDSRSVSVGGDGVADLALYALASLSVLALFAGAIVERVRRWSR